MTQHILLIDLENCQGRVDCLMDDLNQYSKVILCYAKTSARVPLDWLLSLSEMIQQGKLELVKMTQVGKDSADFGLSFLAGRLSVELPESSHFVILSDDKALDYVVQILGTYGHTALRKSGKVPANSLDEVKIISNLETSTKKETKINSEVQKAAHRCCQQLFKSLKKAAHPKSKQALFNMIRNFVKNDDLAKKVFQYLITSSVIMVNTNDSIVVNKAKLETLAKMAI